MDESDEPQPNLFDQGLIEGRHLGIRFLLQALIEILAEAGDGGIRAELKSRAARSANAVWGDPDADPDLIRGVKQGANDLIAELTVDHVAKSRFQ